MQDIYKIGNAQTAGTCYFQSNYFSVRNGNCAFAVLADGSIDHINGRRCAVLAVEGQILARDIRLRVVGGEKICLTGRNGAGKSTLLKMLVPGLLERTDIKVAYIPQKYEDIEGFGDLSEVTPVDFLAEQGDKEEMTKIRTYLGSLKYTLDEMNHPICALSGGQKAKLLLLKTAMSGANVLILDEPTRNFSPLSGPVIRRMLAGFPGAVISVSHDRKFIEEVCDKEYIFTESGLALRE